MIGKKINQLATELAPVSTDLTIIGDPTTGVSKKITLAQLGAIFSGAVSFYTNLAGFPATGDINVIYCAKDTQKLYLWSGSAYVEVFPSQALLDTYQLRSEKGNANGYASLDSQGKVPISQLPSSIMEYKGTWNASTNTPTLANGTGDTGDVYICNVAGTVNFGAGPITFAVGDYVIYSGTIWQRSSGAVGTVTSVAVSRSGDALAITGSPVTTSGTINIGFAGTGAQYIKGDGTLATFPSIISQAQNLVTEVYNSTGATLTKGTVVYINGGQGNLPTVTKALASGDSTSAQTYGIVQADITNMNNGYVVVAGRLSDIDTQAYSVGTQLYLSSTTAGAYTSTKQYAPAHLVYIGIIVRSHPTQGIIEVKIQNGYELDELHNVAAQSPSNGDILQYVSSTSLWTKVAGTTSNIAEGSNLYYTDARSRAALSFTAGSGAYNSTTGVITIPTNTNQLTNGANYITLGSLSASSPLSYNNGTGAFSISQANTSTNGFLSSTDWNTFNGKQSALNGTGFVKISGTTISYDNSTYYLASNPNAYIPLTALSAGAGISYNNTTGVIASTITQYTDALARAAISLTTSGTSGAATYNSTTGVLNVPQYAPDLSGYVPTSRTLTINGTAYDLSANRSWSVGTVTSVGLSSATSGVTIGSTPITTSGTITLAIATASGSQQGLLSSTDWTTFNNKQNALTNPVTGTGTTNYLPKFTGASTIGNSIVQESGSVISVAGSLSAQSDSAYYRIKRAGGTDLGYITDSTTWGASGTDFTIGASSSNLRFFTNNSVTERMRLDASGNLGLGVTPSAWGSLFAGGVLQIKTSSLLGYSNNTYLNTNAYYTNAGDYYIDNGFASRYVQRIGQHQWETAPSGTAGNAISFTQAMTLNASGNLSIGNTNNTYKLDVSGDVRFTGNLRVEGNTDPNSAAAAFFWNQPFLGPTISGYNFEVRTGNTGSQARRLFINETGAATFSSSVTATNAIFERANDSGVILRIGNAGSTYFDFSRSSSTGALSIQGNQTGNNNILLAPTSGSVGIGTTSPNSTLQVRGDNGSSVSAVLRIRDTNSTARTTRLQFEDYAGAYADGLIDFKIPTAGTATGARLDLGVDSVIISLVRGGNVGIGTTSPNLSGAASGSTVQTISATTSGRNALLELNGTRTGDGDFAGYLRYFNNAAATPLAEMYALRGSSDTTGSLVLATSGSERMRITSGGNVEINTGSIKTGEPDTGWGRAAIKIGQRQSGEAFSSGGYLPVNVDGTVYYINLYSSTP